MGHKKLRQERNCLNCGHHVTDRYCSHCGQQNLELKDSAWYLIVHYVQDLFHYDGKLWHTLRNLVLRPGRVAEEYMEGKRVQNLEPIRFYVFASTVFFLLLYLTVGSLSVNLQSDARLDYTRRLHVLQQEKQFAAGSSDTVLLSQLIESLHHQRDSLAVGGSARIGDVEIDLFSADGDDETAATGFGGWIEARLKARSAELESQYEGDEVKATAALLDELFHKIPHLLFLSLPFFAFWLKLLYWRSFRTRYVEHFIFSVYHYAYVFTFYTSYLIVDWLLDATDSSMVETLRPWIIACYFLYPGLYLALSLRRFYQDRWFTLMLKYLVLALLFGITLLFLFLVVAFISFIW